MTMKNLSLLIQSGMIILATVMLTACKTSKNEERLTAEGEFPILAWIGVIEEETSVERFQELKESGINVNFSGYSSIDAVEKALDAAQEAGVKMLPSCPELSTATEETVRRLMKHPALVGYHLRDEPGTASFPELSDWMKRIQSVDSAHYCYINLFPNYVDLNAIGVSTYREYVERFVKEVPVPFISFDFYPITEENGERSLRSRWYSNLEDVLAVSRQSGLPVWAFALAVAHKPYPIPTLAELRLQMFSNLAYGAQTLQYFTYWTPTPGTWDFHDAPIDIEGKPTPVYDLIKQLNSEIQGLAGVFLGARVINVWHTGKEIPEGTKRLEHAPKPFRMIDTGDKGAVVSLLENDGRQFLAIVNRDFKEPLTLTLSFDKTVRQVSKTGDIMDANKSLVLEPGDITVYTWKINSRIPL